MWMFQLLMAVVAENPRKPTVHPIMISAMSGFFGEVFRPKTDFFVWTHHNFQKTNRNKDLLHQIGVDFLGVVMEVFEMQSVVD